MLLYIKKLEGGDIQSENKWSLNFPGKIRAKS